MIIIPVWLLRNNLGTGSWTSPTPPANSNSLKFGGWEINTRTIRFRCEQFEQNHRIKIVKIPKVHNNINNNNNNRDCCVFTIMRFCLKSIHYYFKGYRENSCPRLWKCKVFFFFLRYQRSLFLKLIVLNSYLLLFRIVLSSEFYKKKFEEKIPKLKNVKGLRIIIWSCNI